jgi:hypothetical protein
MVAYPSPAKYEVSLYEDLFDVTAVNLIVADVPFAAYLIGLGHRTVPFSFQCVPVGGDPMTLNASAQLTVGDYADDPSADDLSTELGNALTAAAAAAAASRLEMTPPSFTATYSPRTDSYTVTGSTPFTLMFSSREQGTPAKVLGFGRADYCAASVGDGGTYSVKSPFRRDFRKDRYVVLKLSPNAEVSPASRRRSIARLRSCHRTDPGST